MDSWILTSDWPGAGLRALLRDALALAVPAHAPRTRVRHRGDVPLLPRGGDQRQAAVDTLPNVSNIFFYILTKQIFFLEQIFLAVVFEWECFQYF